MRFAILILVAFSIAMPAYAKGTFIPDGIPRRKNMKRAKKAYKPKKQKPLTPDGAFGFDEADEEAATGYGRPKPKNLQRPNFIGLEFAGRGVLYSLNYDRALGTNVVLGAGFSYMSAGLLGVKATAIAVPLYTNIYFSPDTHRSFLTAGLTLISVSAKLEQDIKLGDEDFSTNISLLEADFPLPMLGGGYEYRSENGVLIRGTFYITYALQVLPWVGITVGGAF